MLFIVNDDEVPADVSATWCIVAADEFVAGAASERNEASLLRVDVSMRMLL